MSDLAERLASGAQQRGIVASYIAGNTVASIGMLLVGLLIAGSRRAVDRAA